MRIVELPSRLTSSAVRVVLRSFSISLKKRKRRRQEVYLNKKEIIEIFKDKVGSPEDAVKLLQKDDDVENLVEGIVDYLQEDIWDEIRDFLVDYSLGVKK